MQFGKLFISSALDLSEAEFYNLVRGNDIGGIDKKDAYKQWLESKPKKVNTKKVIENKKALD